MNGIVGIKPTVGLVGRSGIIPISTSQDTAGPMARSVIDAAMVLSAIAGVDPADPVTTAAKSMEFCSFIKSDGLRDKRIGVVRNYAGFHERVDAVFETALAALTDGGATVIDGLSLPSHVEIRQYELTVMLTEFKVGLNAYLVSLGERSSIRSLAALIAFNETHAERVMPYFGQEKLLQAEKTNGLDDKVYQNALAACGKLTRDNGIDRTMSENHLHALVAPTTSAPWAIDLINGDNRLGGSSSPAAVAGYPSVTVPMGYVSGLPVGLSFIGGAWREGALIGMAYAFEKIMQARIPPGPPTSVNSDYIHIKQ